MNKNVFNIQTNSVFYKNEVVIQKKKGSDNNGGNDKFDLRFLTRYYVLSQVVFYWSSAKFSPENTIYGKLLIFYR